MCGACSFPRKNRGSVLPNYANCGGRWNCARGSRGDQSHPHAVCVRFLGLRLCFEYPATRASLGVEPFLPPNSWNSADLGYIVFYSHHSNTRMQWL